MAVEIIRKRGQERSEARRDVRKARQVVRSYDPGSVGRLAAKFRFREAKATRQELREARQERRDTPPEPKDRMGRVEARKARNQARQEVRSAREGVQGAKAGGEASELARLRAAKEAKRDADRTLRQKEKRHVRRIMAGTATYGRS